MYFSSYVFNDWGFLPYSLRSLSLIIDTLKISLQLFEQIAKYEVSFMFEFTF